MKDFQSKCGQALQINNPISSFSCVKKLSIFNATMKFCDENVDNAGALSNYLKKYLTLIYYPIDDSFNHEIILVFIFGKVDW